MDGATTRWLAIAAAACCMTAGAAMPQQAQATVNVYSVPGQVGVLGDEQRQKVLVTESPTNSNPPNTYLNQVAPALPAYRVLDDRIRIAVSERGAAGSGLGNKLLGPMAGMLLLLLQIQGDNSNIRPRLQITFYVDSPTPVVALPPCRASRLAGDKPLDPGTDIVSCPIFDDRQLNVAPALMIDTGGARDRVFLDLECPTCLSSRRVWAGGGNDTVVGSYFADDLGGNVGNDTLDGRSGDDTIWGWNEGNYGIDIVPEPDDDAILTGEGNDLAFGQIGKDLIYDDGITNNVRVPVNIDVNPVERMLLGDASLNGGEGPDTIVGGLGADIMSGGHNVDSIFAAESDFGRPDVPDVRAECEEKFGLYRMSPGDPPGILNCGSEFPRPFKLGPMFLWVANPLRTSFPWNGS